MQAPLAMLQVWTNTTWDVYANDYARLAEMGGGDSGTMMTTARTTGYAEWRCYFEGKLCLGRVINDLAWHPLWTGLAATAYTTTAKGEDVSDRKLSDEVGLPL